PAIEPRERTDFRDAVVHFRDVAESRETPARQHDLRVGERRCGLCPTEHANRLLAAANLHTPARRIEVERTQLQVHVHGREAERLHACRIELDANLSLHTTAA